MHSWWWVVLPPEKCRAVSRLNKLCNVASCWIYIRIFLQCLDSWTLKSVEIFLTFRIIIIHLRLFSLFF
jgi:hypothetical protein